MSKMDEHISVPTYFTDLFIYLLIHLYLELGINPANNSD